MWNLVEYSIFFLGLGKFYENGWKMNEINIFDLFRNNLLNKYLFIGNIL